MAKKIVKDNNMGAVNISGDDLVDITAKAIAQDEAPCVYDAQIDESVNVSDEHESTESNEISLEELRNDELVELKSTIDELTAKLKDAKKRLKDLNKPAGSVTGPSKKSLMLKYLVDNPEITLKVFVTHAMTEWDSSPIYANSCYKLVRKG